MPYLITGATGPVGRSIVTQLRTIGQDVRIITRDVRKAPVIETINTFQANHDYDTIEA
jgi:uncharacterized protein YbjT (DUF2867 family)